MNYKTEANLMSALIALACVLVFWVCLHLP